MRNCRVANAGSWLPGGETVYLKSLEIQGFKSFPDRISLTFDKGLTAVVGPNGSGKSNISDSVRWVLGEQSTKTLRGNKMEDVIFSGTDTRKPMGFAAVTLNIDNSDNVLTDMGDEVTVTRKLYRSGESEYIINGKQCRLKDINELFMDTGLGRDGYSIIGQGKIAEIVSAKSTDRRDIFEEAAGISKFRYRKQEAERKLEGAQENIIRLSDIISELESRIGPLKTQSEKAKKFITLAEERKKLEISVWMQKLDELNEKIRSIDEKLLVSRSEYENIESDIERREEKRQKSYRIMQESTAESDGIRRKMIEEEQLASELKSGIAVYENDISHCESMIENAKEGLKNSDRESKKLDEDLSAAESELENIGNELNNLENEIAETEKSFEDFRKRSREIADESGRAGDKINDLYIKQSEYRFSCEAAERAAADAEARLKELESVKAGITETLKNYAGETERMKADLLKNSEKRQSSVNTLSGLEKLYDIKKQNFENSRKEYESLLYKLKEKQQRYKILSDLENNMEGISGSVRTVLRASKQGRLSGVYGTVAQNITVDEKYAVAIETALGGAMQNIITENEDIAKRCIRYLKEQNAGRATFLPVTSVKGKELHEQGLEENEGFLAVACDIVGCDIRIGEIIRWLLGRTVIAEDIDLATLIAKKYGYRFRIVTLDGQIINTGGSFTGGSVQKSGGMITRKNEIAGLDSEIKDLLAERDILGKKTEKLRAESEKLRLGTEGAGESIQNCDNAEIKLKAELSGLETLVKQLEDQYSDIEKQADECKEKIKTSDENIKTSEKALEEIDARIKKAEREFAEGSDERESLRIAGEKLSEKLSGLKMRRVEITKDIQAKENDITRITAQKEDILKGGDALCDEIAVQERMISETEEKIKAAEEKLSAMRDNTSVYNARIERLRQIHDEQSRVADEIMRAINEINTAKEKLTGEITRLEERRDTVRRDSEDIIKQLYEVYELTRSEASEIAGKIDDPAAASRELAEIKNKIKALGNVNVESIDEYREVSERYEFMSAQMDDVQKSKSELEKIISGLTEEMCRMFSESFDKINEEFKKIFRELFGGGKAQLSLTDPENVLESGIEISVAPPGKVIKNLISLSGGEQAFVAIAIYFAILRLRPAPFCILDEIDAALDEVNVRKYARYLKKFTDTTQFILVTHRRSAMEEANVLYGVTMQEDGISRLLKMQQAEPREND